MTSNDKYELPWFVADSFEEMAEWLKGIEVNACKNSFRQSTSGIVRAANGSCKYMRIDRRSGAVIIGAELSRKNKTKKRRAGYW